MNINHVKYTVAALVVAGLVSFGSPSAQAKQKILKGDSGLPGAASHTMMIVFSKIFARELGVSVQVNEGQTLTKSALKLGTDKIDLLPLPPSIYDFMTKGSRMYRKKLKNQAIAASKNVRGVMGYLANMYHAIAFEKSGIKNWKDIKGKRVFTGPPAGAAAVNVESLIDVITGYKPNKDYKAIHLPWGSGLQAMMDGQLDVYIRPQAPGSAVVEQLGLTHKFWLLSTTNEIVQSKAWQRYLRVPGRVTGVIPAKTYKGQLGNKDIIAGGSTFQFAVRKSLDEDMAYKMTKAIWDNLDEIHQTGAVLRAMKKETPFVGMNTPLHKGALRYYKEKGFEIPAYLVPPEAR